MLKFIKDIPNDFPIAGVHCVPVLENGNLLMVWDREEQVLTTIGGRLENSESLFEGLKREAIEEAGIILDDSIVPFASWFWQETKSYTIFYLAKIKKFIEMPDGFEKTGYIITNFNTAIDMIKKIEGRGERIEIINKAGILAGQLKEVGNSR
ncbi:NUDIX hydrolase [Paenibacillaceae bacterium]|nr:NUDIX hydrolase [Paenibacillaceae bacterium]